MSRIKGIAIVFVCCAVVSFIILRVIGMVIGMRVEEETERDGRDFGLHGESVQS